MIKKLFILLIPFLFFGCKDNFSVDEFHEEYEYLQASVKIPVYKNNEKFSTYIKDAVETDYQKYKAEALEEWEVYHSDVLTYRTEVQDYSNKDYLNVMIHKYIFAGISMEDEYIITYTYDKKLKKVVDVYEITGKTEEELKLICKNYFENKYDDLTGYPRSLVFNSIELNLAYKRNMFSSFIADKHNVEIYFGPSKLLPKGYGVQTLSIKL